MNLSKFLEKAQSNWQETVTKANTSSFENPADGIYISQLSSAELGEAKSSGKPQIKWGFTVIEGDLQGTTKYDYMQLDGQLGLDPLAWRLNSLGVKIEDVDLTQLQSMLDDLVSRNMVMKMTLKTKPNTDFQNLRITMLRDTISSSID